MHAPSKEQRSSRARATEITEAVRPGFGVIRTLTAYGPNERVISQTVTTREFSGTVRTFEILNGKVLP